MKGFEKDRFIENETLIKTHLVRLLRWVKTLNKSSMINQN